MIMSRRLRWAGHVPKMEGGRSAFKMSIGKHTGNRSLGRARNIWEENNGMNLKEIGLIRLRIGVIGASL